MSASPAPAYEPDRRTDTLLRIAGVRSRTGLSIATIYRREAEGSFPRKQRMGPKMVGWYLSDVEDWIADPLGYRVSEPVPPADR